ncbi:2-haloacid dehalogenase [Actinomadura luteofluorescens]|uniref:2-haloacid dehalogenase n=1 Tax=Actinomadura luteofluorescens TaxID=46163 RepID=A0A7Y9JD56_9ACTN|nr:haloacid dehalogenase type II [Actinomadura luteofluorescens]NYD44560.1 2-haloacid dehalogenase [Actinomadura luteofluorescens]
MGFDVGAIRVVACDIFGTTVDWRTGVAGQVAAIAAERGVALEGEAFADDWRERYLPSMQRVSSGEREWAYLDTLHRESLDELLELHGVADAFDEDARRRLVRAWHRLPAWDDSVDGLAGLRERYVVAALSNGGFALLTNLVKGAGLPFDCILSAELARTYKPEPEAYLTAVRLLDVEPAEVLMVAAHKWDIDGARGAGLATAFLERPLEKGPSLTADRADDVESDLVVRGFGELAVLLEAGRRP